MDEAKVTYSPVPFSAPGILVSVVAFASAKRSREPAERASGCSVSLEGLVTRRDVRTQPPSVDPVSVRLGDSTPTCTSNLLIE